MNVHRRNFLGSGIALLGGTAAKRAGAATIGGDPSAPFFPPLERFPLWPGKPPGAPAQPIIPNWTMNNSPPNRELWIRGVPFPEVHVYRPARADGSALLVLPGGGYGFLSIQNEGLDAAERFNAERTTVFILTYRLPAEGWAHRSHVPLQDAQRAMRLIRARASDFRIDPSSLGVLGFSAGGHLAADLAVAHAERVYDRVDSADSQSARPAFAGLVYPVISLDPTISTGSTGPNLLGHDPTAEQIAARSPALHVRSDTAPSFIVAAFDDPIVHMENSLAWIESCRRAKVLVEAHLLSKGGHGFGLHLPKSSSGALWPDLFARWVRDLPAGHA